MPDYPQPEIGERAVGILADKERWSRTLPPYTHPQKVIRGLVLAVYPTAPGVAELRDDRTGNTVMVRDARPEVKAVRDATR